MQSLIRRTTGLARDKGVVIAVFLANFTLARGAAYFGPLILAALLTAGDYGAVEVALALALILASVIGLGVSNALPQMSLLRRATPLQDVLAGQLALCGIALTASGLVLHVMGHDLPALVAAMTVTALLQSNLGHYLRTFSHRNLAVWIDGIAMLLALALTIVLWSAGRAEQPWLASRMLAAAAAITAAAGWIAWGSRQPKITARAMQAASIGMPLMVYGFSTQWLAFSGRILGGGLLSLEAVALYALCLRLSSMILAAHHAMMIALFSQIFTIRTRRFDRLFASYIAVQIAISIMLAHALPAALHLVPTNAIPDSALESARALLPTLTLTVFAMLVSAPLETRISRARLAWPATIANLLLAAAGAATSLALARHGTLSVSGLAAIVAVQWILVVAAQIAILWRRGLVMWRVAAVASAGVLAIALIAVLAAARV